MIEFVVVFVAVVLMVGYVLLRLELGRQRTRHEKLERYVLDQEAWQKAQLMWFKWHIGELEGQLTELTSGACVCDNNEPQDG